MNQKIQAVILAGGKGTRLAPLTDNLPKPLVPIAGKPMIYYVLEHLRKFGILNVAISIAHLGNMIVDELGDGARLGMNIEYLQEPEPMGTGGWSLLIDWKKLDDQFLVLNADNLFWIDIKKLLSRNQAEGAVATIAGIEIEADKHKAYELCLPNKTKTRLIDYVDRDSSAPYLQNNKTVFVSSGWYVMTPAVSEFVPNKSPVSNETDIWPALNSAGKTLGFYAAQEPWFDSGTHERLRRVENFIQKNVLYE